MFEGRFKYFATISEIFRRLPKTYEDFRRFPKIFKNFGNLLECWFFNSAVLFPQVFQRIYKHSTKET